MKVGLEGKGKEPDSNETPVVLVSSPSFTKKSFLQSAVVGHVIFVLASSALIKHQAEVQICDVDHQNFGDRDPTVGFRPRE